MSNRPETGPASEPPAPETEPVPEPSPARPRRRGLWIGAGLVALIVAAIVISRSGNSASKAQAAARARAQAPIPVVVAPAQIADFPVYLTGLGTVTPLATVTVRSRVDGQLLRVDFREGQLVKEGDVLAEIDPRPFQVQLTQAEGQLAKDEAALANTKLDLNRFKDLVAQGLIPQQQYDAQVSTVAQAEAAIKTDQGSIDAAKLNLTYARITAPITGRAGLRQVDPGNMVHATDQGGIVVLTELDPIAVLFTLPEDSLQAVLRKLRTGATLPVEAWDRDLKNRLETGRLLTVDNQIDPTTGTVRLKAQFDNHDGGLFPQQFVNVRLLIETLTHVVVVPSAAIQRTTRGPSVFVVGADGKVAMRLVEVSQQSDARAVVAKGVSAGELVVVDGVDKLQEGSKVVARQAGSAPAGTAPASPRPS
ncbi:MAG TPA: MdtA/MuxA family multidrug efflux RND transporter periplasmic adaptor subunit [Thermoanaerobaculia bacterium]|nr:MdtA/MuxA family multidrug efflux RND transporter periplasmic adaptor subunit [Thermoanaerobaculia bacterium]